MRDPKRIPAIIHAIEAFWTRYPDFRLGQIVVNATTYGDLKEKLFNVEDDDFLRAFREFEGWYDQAAARDF